MGPVLSEPDISYTVWNKEWSTRELILDRYFSLNSNHYIIQTDLPYVDSPPESETGMLYSVGHTVYLFTSELRLGECLSRLHMLSNG